MYNQSVGFAILIMSKLCFGLVLKALTNRKRILGEAVVMYCDSMLQSSRLFYFAFLIWTSKRFAAPWVRCFSRFIPRLQTIHFSIGQQEPSESSPEDNWCVNPAKYPQSGIALPKKITAEDLANEWLWLRIDQSYLQGKNKVCENE